jgi:dolichol-phosphate mannosyltransferase
MGGVIHLGMLYLLTEYLHMWYIFSAILAFICAVTHNFLMNKYWTFRDTAPYIYAQFVIFFIISCITLGIHLTVLYVLTEYLGLWYMLAQCIAILIGLSNNYLGNKTFTFKEKNGEKKRVKKHNQ